MEKWKFSSDIESAVTSMDMSQISELATAIMDSWPSSSGIDPLIGSPNINSPEHKMFPIQIKQEVPDDYDFPGVISLQGYPSTGNPGSEHMPMEDIDPLESFSFWDGENFYNHPDADGDMQLDKAMPTLPEFDELTSDDTFPIKDLMRNNPTLAELNSCGESSIFDYTMNNNNSNLFTSEDSSFGALLNDNLSKSFPTESHFAGSPVPQTSLLNSSFASDLNFGMIADIKPNVILSSSCPSQSRILQQQFLNPFDDKIPQCPQNTPVNESFFPNRIQLSPDPINSYHGHASPLMIAQSKRLQEKSMLSSSAPPDMTLATYFSNIKSESQATSPSGRSVTERSLSGFSSLSLSTNEDDCGSFLDDEEEDDFSSDEDAYQYDSDDALSTSWSSSKDESKSSRKHRYFWQYNLQSRGSKAQNVIPKIITEDPHVLNDAFDPVFSEDCILPVKHSGKARRGDGNDLTPDPKKLYSIGIELKKLNKLIYNIHPEGSAPHGKSLSRKEKNKLASRVCRLKKKAQHEANKIKLYGLQREHKKLLSILVDTKELLRYKVEHLDDKKVSQCSKKLGTFLASNEPHKVAGSTATFVNEVLDKVSKGHNDGGLNHI